MPRRASRSPSLSMRRAKTGAAKETKSVRPGIMPTLFGHHMIGSTMFLALDEMAEGLPDMFEYIGGECPPPPEPTGNAEQDEASLARYETMKAFWVNTACYMEPDQKAEYDRIESTLDFASKELLKRGSMKLLGTMLATTIGWPDYCHAEWAMDDDVLKSIMEAANDPDAAGPGPPRPVVPEALRLQLRLRREALILKRPDTGETDRIPLVKHGGVYWLDVTFNGGKTRRLVYDTGASSISLSLLMAAELGLAPQPGDPEVMAQVADGRLVKAKGRRSASVKVGKFTVTDVEATIETPAARPHGRLLGQAGQQGHQELDGRRHPEVDRPAGRLSEGAAAHRHLQAAQGGWPSGVGVLPDDRQAERDASAQADPRTRGAEGRHPEVRRRRSEGAGGVDRRQRP